MSDAVNSRLEKLIAPLESELTAWTQDIQQREARLTELEEREKQVAATLAMQTEIQLVLDRREAELTEREAKSQIVNLTKIAADRQRKIQVLEGNQEKLVAQVQEATYNTIEARKQKEQIEETLNVCLVEKKLLSKEIARLTQQLKAAEAKAVVQTQTAVLEVNDKPLLVTEFAPAGKVMSPEFIEVAKAAGVQTLEELSEVPQ